MAWQTVDIAILCPDRLVVLFYFGGGLLEESDWKASFITSSKRFGPEFPLQPVRFRKTFSLNAPSWSRARLYISALGVYEVYVNGQRASRDIMAPGWTSYRYRLNYAVLDVGALLLDAQVNAIAIEVGEGWYAGKLGFRGGSRFLYGQELAAFCQLEIDTEAGRLTVKSDESWTCGPSAIQSSEIYNGEVYDMREERPWKMPSDDCTSFVEVTLIEPQPSPRLIAPRAPPVRVIEERAIEAVFRSESGKTIIDFGQNLVGKLLIKSCLLHNGHDLVLRHAEVMEHGELGTRPLCGARCEDRIIGSGEMLQNWMPKFTFHGFRYVQVDGWPGDEASIRDNVVAVVMHSNLKRQGHFECSNNSVNQLHQNVVWSMRGNFLSVPTDCPQRDERLGWTGDINIFAPTASFLYDTVGFLEDWLEDLAVEQLTEGAGVPGLVCPYVPLPDWPRIPQAIWHDVTIMLPDHLYQITADPRILQRQFDSMRAWLERGIDRGSDGLWSLYRWQLGDWLDPTAPPQQPALSRTDSVLVADAYLVHVTATFARICQVLGEDELGVHYDAEGSRLRSAFRAKYITSAGNLMSNTQTGLALAIVFGLYSSEQLPLATEQLSKLVRSARFHIATGFVGTPAITRALTMASQPQLAYRMLLEKGLPSWLYPISMGATTIWERWDSVLPDGSINPGRMTSMNHYALGAVAQWLHESVGGLKLLDPQTVLVQPVPGGNLTWAETSLDCPCGLIRCRWSLEPTEDGKLFTMRLEVPPNASALVKLPDSVNKTLVHDAENVQRVMAGSHRFSCLWGPAEWPPKVLLPPNLSYTAEMDEVGT